MNRRIFTQKTLLQLKNFNLLDDFSLLNNNGFDIATFEWYLRSWISDSAALVLVHFQTLASAWYRVLPSPISISMDLTCFSWWLIDCKLFNKTLDFIYYTLSASLVAESRMSSALKNSECETTMQMIVFLQRGEVK